MKTRIRELRKSRGWTLQKVADLVGTTAQTVQRLETANMTVSMDWLERFSKAFSVQPSSLIRDDDHVGVPFLGTLSDSGDLRSMDKGNMDQMETVDIAVDSEDPIAVRLSGQIGPYSCGATLIANKLNSDELYIRHTGGPSAIDSLVFLEDGTLILCKALWLGNEVICIPLAANLDVLTGLAPLWIAPIIMEIRYF